MAKAKTGKGKRATKAKGTKRAAKAPKEARTPETPEQAKARRARYVLLQSPVDCEVIVGLLRKAVKGDDLTEDGQVRAKALIERFERRGF